MVNQLLTEMDGLEARKQVFIMGATNRPGVCFFYVCVIASCRRVDVCVVYLSIVYRKYMYVYVMLVIVLLLNTHVNNFKCNFFTTDNDVIKLLSSTHDLIFLLQIL